ncbi:MAG: type II toxin-antitoxin system VapC family toxin [Terracidiphilus sp.]|jgi:predicted nucleic acid-binding protein
MILADTTICVDHFRARNDKLRALLEDERIAMHPFIVAELALGSLKQRAVQLRALDDLLAVPVARLDEVRRGIEAHRLYSWGIGLIDAHLIASCLIHPPTRLWTNDKRLAGIAETLGIAADIS